jgi:hypothetical protein
MKISAMNLNQPPDFVALGSAKASVKTKTRWASHTLTGNIN